MLSAVFFDLDETLIDADGCHREASRRAFAAFGMDWDAALTRTGPFFGRRMREILEARRDALGVDESTAPVDALLALRWEHYVDLFPAGVCLLPGASEAVASVSDHAAVAADPECYEVAYHRLQSFRLAAKHDCLVVEDSSIGVTAARSAGIPVCLIPRYPLAESVRSEYALTSLAEFPALVARLSER
jgi:beta-phosphoglucomutase-like phosphatase (HAD superfamily)